MEFVRGGEIVGNLGAVSPLRLALRATSPVSGRLTVAALPKVGDWRLCAEGALRVRKGSLISYALCFKTLFCVNEVDIMVSFMLQYKKNVEKS